MEDETALKRNLISNPNEPFELCRTKINTHNGPNGMPDFLGYVWHGKTSATAAMPYGYDRNYYAEHMIRAPSALKGRLFFEMDREMADKWKTTFYMTVLKDISFVNENDEEIKIPGVVYPADTELKDQ